jgi:VanZ family protein
MGSSTLPSLRVLLRWAPSLLWTAVVLAASSDLFSAAHTGGVVAAVLRAIAGHVSEETFAVVHYLVRKLAHLTEYGIASMLYFYALIASRAARSANSGTIASGVDEMDISPAGHRPLLHAQLLAVLIVLCVATIDEYHQSFVPSRSGSVADILLDGTGGAIAQLILRWESRRRVNC